MRLALLALALLACACSEAAPGIVAVGEVRASCFGGAAQQPQSACALSVLVQNQGEAAGAARVTLGIRYRALGSEAVEERSCVELTPLLRPGDVRQIDCDLQRLTPPVYPARIAGTVLRISPR